MSLTNYLFIFATAVFMSNAPVYLFIVFLVVFSAAWIIDVRRNWKDSGEAPEESSGDVYVYTYSDEHTDKYVPRPYRASAKTGSPKAPVDLLSI